MIDIISYLIEQFYTPQDCPDAATLSRHLAAVGFDSQDIDDALNWLREWAELDADPYAQLAGDVLLPRPLHPREAERLSTEAQAFYYYLSSTGALGFGQRELLLDRLMQAPHASIDVAGIKHMALMLLWRQGSDLANLLIGELLRSDSETTMH